MMPVQVYPLFEQAHRIALGGGLDQHLDEMAQLGRLRARWRRPTPTRWIEEAYTAEEIRTPSPNNRMIGFPYTKRMNSNNSGGAGRRAHPGARRRGPRRSGCPVIAGCSPTRHRCPRSLLRERARRPRPLPRHAHRRSGLSRPGRRRRRRPRPHRPLLLLPVGRGDLGLRVRDRSRPAAHRHRRPVVCRGTVEQLCDPLDRGDGRSAAPKSPARSGW